MDQKLSMMDGQWVAMIYLTMHPTNIHNQLGCITLGASWGLWAKCPQWQACYLCHLGACRPLPRNHVGTVRPGQWLDATMSNMSRPFWHDSCSKQQFGPYCPSESVQWNWNFDRLRLSDCSWNRMSRVKTLKKVCIWRSGHIHQTMAVSCFWSLPPPSPADAALSLLLLFWLFLLI